MSEIETKYDQYNIERDMLHEYVDYYFSHVFFNAVLNLPEEEKSNVFTMMTTHVDVLSKLLNSGNFPLFDHIKGNSWQTANTVSENNSHVTINYDQAQPLITAYDEWKSNRNTN